MTKTIRCDVVSAQGEIFSGEVTMVFATGVAGELGISPRHARRRSGQSSGGSF